MSEQHASGAAQIAEPERTTPKPGTPAPDFSLPDAEGRIHHLADQRGRWTVVYFYPEDDTAGCTTEACQFRDLEGDITNRSADVWGISPDDAASHRRFRDKFGLPFTLLSDVEHGVSKAYGAWGPKKSYGRDLIGMTRSTYLVDPKGVVARAWPKVKADGHAAEVLAALEEARAAAG
jgi:thioredoxin-dependent peroxiredoxin